MTDTDPAFLAEVLDGLSQPQKTLHPKWLYDLRGSELFEEITDVPEYYPTRTEATIFARAFPELHEMLPNIRAVIEYGSGSSKKTGPLLEALKPEIYVPSDISEEFLKDAATDLQDQHPDVDVIPLVADFTEPISLPSGLGAPEERLGFFPGSTIGNFEPGTAVPFLSRVRTSLGDGAYFLISGDLIKSREILEAAYDDAGGVTAAFNLNLLTRMNRELGADFDEDGFVHRSVWNADLSRVEMHLVATRPQTVTIDGKRFDFAEGETIHTENSYKYTVDGFEEMGARAGWSLAKYWTDENDLFGVFLLKG
ncbi:L-histidine N(alpha)-methyltransferase [Parvularcula marina]|uniref:L-histidine N(Alpha)-methyltransferase n=1 Tax=Parvularcula marina TaxID=2292771 RepID=A0A371RJG1_9PROT|nr:L-histidine N(alpha)-methyltransferase [Parvularcula marina]RFB05566.1 L-histidine N(alpha)-methyltransferase [Parvularcula marina]